jgi:ABC-type sugar transport system substrate-binding protein
MRPHKLMAAGLSLALVGAVACGDDDDTQASTSDEGGSEGGGAAGEAVTIEAGDDMNAILLPKCTGIAVFDQANEGAQRAAEELGASAPEFLGPSTCEDPTGQIETMTNAATQGVDAVMISNNAGEQISPASTPRPTPMSRS